MRVHKMYCGNCGFLLRAEANFGEDPSGQRCSKCQTLNPPSFRYCYRCGVLMIRHERHENEEDQVINPS